MTEIALRLERVYKAVVGRTYPRPTPLLAFAAMPTSDRVASPVSTCAHGGRASENGWVWPPTGCRDRWSR